MVAAAEATTMASSSSPTPMTLQQLQSNAIRTSMLAHNAKYAYSTSVSQLIPTPKPSSSGSSTNLPEDATVLNICASSLFESDDELRRLLGPTFVPSTYINKVMFRHTLTTTIEPMRAMPNR